MPRKTGSKIGTAGNYLQNKEKGVRGGRRGCRQDKWWWKET